MKKFLVGLFLIISFFSCFTVANAARLDEYPNIAGNATIGADEFVYWNSGSSTVNNILFSQYANWLKASGLSASTNPTFLSGNITGLTPSIVITTASGAHTTTDNSAALIHANDSSATNAYVGMTLYNITDVSSCTVTASTTTGMTCTLAGGSDNNWDIDDAYQVGPGPLQSGAWFYVTNASTIRHPATVGYLVCYESDAAAALTVDMASASMIFQGVLDALVVVTSAGEYILSSGSTTGDYMCIHNKSATEAQGKGKRGTWTQE